MHLKGGCVFHKDMEELWNNSEEEAVGDLEEWEAHQREIQGPLCGVKFQLWQE